MSETPRLSPGDTAPDFTLNDDTGAEVSLSGLRGRKVIVYFYPAAMTPGCTKQACDFTESLESLRGAGYEVLGISPDKPEKLGKFREKESLGITLLSDPDKSVMTAYGAFGEKKLYGKIVQGVIRSTGGIVIPATAAMGGRRLAWARVVAVGPHARAVQKDDRVLFEPDDKSEVEVHGELYVVMRERDVHAVAADRVGDDATGLYL